MQPIDAFLMSAGVFVLMAYGVAYCIYRQQKALKESRLQSASQKNAEPS